MRPLLLAAIALLTTSCAAVTGTGGSISSLALPANAAFDSAYRSGDADAVAALMTADAVISAEGIPDVAGRDVIRDVLGRFFATSRVQAFTLQPIELKVAGDMAFERGTFIYSAGPTEGDATTRTGRYTLLRLREGGTWRMHRYMESCLPSPCQ
jgi:uncharacterized protein (TIGR02246 family)